MRFFNATTDTGSVDVFLTPIGATGDLGEVLPNQTALTSGSLSGFRDIGAGSWRLRVTGAGDPNDVRLDIPSITLPGKKYATLVVTAGAGGVLVNGTLIEQRAGRHDAEEHQGTRARGGQRRRRRQHRRQPGRQHRRRRLALAGCRPLHAGDLGHRRNW